MQPKPHFIIVFCINNVVVMSLFKHFLFFVAACLGPVITVLCLWLDLNFFRDTVSELSVTEIVQEAVLAAVAVMHFLFARRYTAFRQCNILIGGLFLAMLIRELDAVFDMIAHGSWVWFALATSAITLVCPLVKWKTTAAQLQDYTRTPGYGMMMAGLITILVFSRLLGMGELWGFILQDGYVRAAKNAVEEGCEMYGYLLCLTATVGYAFSLRRQSAA